MKVQNSIETDRKFYFDYLRVFAIFAVIIIHVSSQNWYKADVNGYDWQMFNLFDSIARWGVPIFVMISGSLFLNREIPLKKIYSKYVLRMVVAFVVWSAVYACFIEGGFSERVDILFRGRFHMWFIFMIVGLYICLPLIKPIIKEEKTTKYFLALAFMFAYVTPYVITLATDFGNEWVIKGASALKDDLASMNMGIISGYIGYFVLGYFLDKTDLSKKQRICIYLLGVVGFVLTIVLSLVVSIKTQEPCIRYYGGLTVNVLFESMAVFTWFKYRDYTFPKLNSIIVKLSKYSFGAYLVHILILEQLESKWGLNSLSFNPAISVISIGFLVAVCSFLISGLLNQIPLIKKYVV